MNYNYGRLLGLFIVIQIITGIICALFYAVINNLTYLNLFNYIIIIPPYYFIKYIHANGASFLFIILYIHIGRSLYNISYMKKYL